MADEAKEENITETTVNKSTDEMIPAGLLPNPPAKVESAIQPKTPTVKQVSTGIEENKISDFIAQPQTESAIQPKTPTVKQVSTSPLLNPMVDYIKLYNDLVNKAGELGYKVVDVSDNELHDYLAMNPIFAKTINYNMPDNEIHINGNKNEDYRVRYESLRHELEEMAELEQNNLYWDAHTEALKTESNTKLETVNLPKPINEVEEIEEIETPQPTIKQAIKDTIRRNTIERIEKPKKPKNFEKMMAERWGNEEQRYSRPVKRSRRNTKEDTNYGLKKRYYLGHELPDNGLGY